MGYILSFITFLPLAAAVVMALFLRGDDEAAQRIADITEARRILLAS